MNYRVGDIIEVKIKGVVKEGRIESFGKSNKTSNVILDDAVRNSGHNKWSYPFYETVSVKLEDIIRTIKRKRGKKYKKKYEMILIDKDGNITDK